MLILFIILAIPCVLILRYRRPRSERIRLWLLILPLAAVYLLELSIVLQVSILAGNHLPAGIGAALFWGIAIVSPSYAIREILRKKRSQLYIGSVFGAISLVVAVSWGLTAFP